MNFVLRQISRRTGAPDIVRTRALPAEPIIGRGSDCDIQLTDLAVSLRHAVLRAGTAGHVTIEALGNERFEANGAFVSRAELAFAQSPRLNFGHHVITLAPGEKHGDVLVTLTAEEHFSGSAAASDQKHAFSLKDVLFSQRRTAWAISLLILALCLALPVGEYLLARNQHHAIATVADRQWSSGPLSPGHHFLENNCVACHQQAFAAVRDTACLSCHQADLNKLAVARLSTTARKLGSPFAPDPAPDHAAPDRLEQAMLPDPNVAHRINNWIATTFSHPDNRCASCHIEHVGNGEAGKRPVTPDQITRNDCANCHAAMKQRLPDTTLSDVPDWGHHPEFRALIVAGFGGQKPRLERAALPHPEKPGLKFNHEMHLKASGGVQRMAQDLGRAHGYGAQLTCASCHRFDDRGSFVPIKMERDCGACHSLAFARSNGVTQTLPHGHPDKVVAALKVFYASQPDTYGIPEAFVGRPGLRGIPRTVPIADRLAAGVRAAFSTGGTCFTCHSVVPPAAGALSFKIAPVKLTSRYLPRGGFNHNVLEHRQNANGAPTCKACHKAESSARAEDLMLPSIVECNACHGKTKAQTAAPAGADCAGCHGFHNPGEPVTDRRRELVRDMLIRRR